MNVRRAIVGCLGQTVTNDAARRSTYAPGGGLIGTIKDLAGGLGEQLAEDFLDRGQIGVKVEMFLLYIKYQGMLGVKQGDRAVAFVAFGHEKFAARVPVRVGPENRDFSADVMRRMQSAFTQDVRGHRGRRCFTVHSDDENPALRRHDRSQCFRATRSFLPAFLSALQNRVVLFDCGRINDQLGVACVGSAMLLIKS